MDSIDSNNDLELIAALIDGRLSGEERARAMKLLADSDEALELFANTLQHQQATPEVSVVVPITKARRWRQWKTIVPLAAAAGLAIVAVPKLTGRGTQADLAKAYAMELTQDPRFAGGLRSGWDQRWAATRGGPETGAPGTRATGSPMESRLAFRLGARSVDLQIALQRGDTALSERFANEIVETLKGVAFSELVGTSYTELKSRLATDSRDQSIERASAAERELRDLLGSSLLAGFEFGEWVAAAELAAQTHDASFFESHGASSIRSSSLASEDVEALGAIDARVKKGLTDPALDEVHDVLQSIIRRRGG